MFASENGTELTLYDGETSSTVALDADQVLSLYPGQSYELTATQPVTVFLEADGGAIDD